MTAMGRKRLSVNVGCLENWNLPAGGASRPGAGTEQSSCLVENGRSYTPDLHQARTYLRDVSLTSISYDQKGGSTS